MAKLSNPFAFARWPVTVITAFIYTAIIVVLIVVNTTLPDIPSSLPNGVNLTEAWLDLQHLSFSHHPYNTRANDFVRDFLLLRIQSTLAENRVAAQETSKETASAYVFSDLTSNLSYSSAGSTQIPGSHGISVYFEGTNIIVYIRGSEDDQSDWWNSSDASPEGNGGVLVNAHYDSVSTGYGATDDGVGVVSILQLIGYYTTPGNAPKRGLVALLNNGEEDFLNGANAFMKHPMSTFPHTFLNLEGAGAGGRAVLFRSTDAQVTKAYKNSPHPFGSVVTGDGFEAGLVRSQTDYVVFNGKLGMRGLDVAFFEPRARYHTDQDDAKHTSKESLWNMLSAAVATTEALTSDTSSDFEGESAVKGGVDAGRGSRGVWFDLFGLAFAVGTLHTLFAFSVTLLVVAPVFIILTMIALAQTDRLYLFARFKSGHRAEGDEQVPLHGLRGYFRWPLVFTFSCAAPVALAYLLKIVNPQIVHSSDWSVWSMMVASFVLVAWCCCCFADYIRPSALTRAYCLLWMFVAWWFILVACTIFETQLKMSGGYFVLIFFAAIFLATWISLLELLALPGKKAFVNGDPGAHLHSRRESASSRQLLDDHHAQEDREQEDAEAEEANERTGLLAGRGRSSFANYSGNRNEEAIDSGKVQYEKATGEQEWSKSMPQWIWLLQFILVAPIVIVVVGQLGLLIVAALHQTSQDGSEVFIVYMMMAGITIITFSPMMPFMHRLTYHIPLLMFFVVVGTVVYNITAFPFSESNRVKLFFQQQVDLDSGMNNASMVGLTGYVQEAVNNLPSASGQELYCVTIPPGRKQCTWTGLPPRVVDPESELPPETRYRTWLDFNITRDADAKIARFNVSGRNTRACK